MNFHERPWTSNVHETSLEVPRKFHEKETYCTYPTENLEVHMHSPFCGVASRGVATRSPVEAHGTTTWVGKLGARAVKAPGRANHQQRPRWSAGMLTTGRNQTARGLPGTYSPLVRPYPIHLRQPQGGAESSVPPHDPRPRHTILEPTGHPGVQCTSRFTFECGPKPSGSDCTAAELLHRRRIVF